MSNSHIERLRAEAWARRTAAVSSKAPTATKAEHRERIARDVDAYLRRGGAICTLPGPAAVVVSRRIGFGRTVRDGGP